MRQKGEIVKQGRFAVICEVYVAERNGRVTVKTEANVKMTKKRVWLKRE